MGILSHASVPDAPLGLFPEHSVSTAPRQVRVNRELGCKLLNKS
jgi:hypothetical protein